MGYQSIATDTLIDNSNTDFRLYIKIGNDLINYTKPGHHWSKDELNRLVGKGFQNFWIANSDLAKYNNYITLYNSRETMSYLNPKEKIASIQDVGMTFTKCLFESELTPETLDQANYLSTSLIDTLLEDLSSVQAITGLASHDYYTYYHSVRVATYASAIAIKLGIHDEKLLKEIALGGILHDIGKKDISMDIINKAGPSTNEEWDLMRSHPEAGAKIVRDSD